MPELLDDVQALESTTIGIYRTSATVKGGRRFSYSALVVVGDRSGRVGMGYGKANQVPPAIEKAQKEAKRKMRLFPLQGRTIPHAVTGKFGACIIRVLPASPGTGVIAGGPVRAVFEMLGVQDCLTKCYGSTNPKNLVKAVFDGLGQLRSRQTVEALRGVEIGATSVEEAIERGKAYIAESVGTEKAVAPKNIVGQEKGARGKGRGRGRGGRGGGRGRRREPRETAETSAETTAEPSSDQPQAETPAPRTAPGEGEEKS